MAPALTAAVLFHSPAAHAQSTAEISGVVSDATGAILPSAVVIIREKSTNATRQVTANSAGVYEFANLNPGSYVVTSAVSGFSTFTANVDVTVGATVALNVKLSPGAATTVIDVSSNEAVQVNTETPEVSQVITSEQVSELPSLTRNPYDFVALSGNISGGDNTAAGTVQNGSNRGVNFSLNGQRNSGTEILLDGIENIQVFGDGVGIIVPIDDVQEYRVITNNYPAVYGRASGGVVSVATKAGTNQFHGTGWEFNRISALASNTVTNAQLGVTKGVFTRNQFGGAVGGPIVKDKLFFFGTTELTRIRSSSPNISAIPTTQLLAATASNVQSYFSTYSGPTNATVLSQTTNLEAGGGTTSLYPTLASTLPVFNVVQFNVPADAGGGVPQNTYNITGRVDYNLGQATQMFFRYVDYHEIDEAGSTFASPYSQYNVGFANLSSAYLYSLGHEFSSTVSTITKLSFSRFNQSNSYDTALQNTPTLFVSSNARDPYSDRPIQLPGFYDTDPANGGLPYGGPQDTIQWNQDLNWNKGHHQFQFGGQVLYIQMNQAYGAYAQAAEQLGESQTQGLDNLLTGNLFEFEAAVNPEGKFPCIKNQYTGAYTTDAACEIALPATQPSFARSDRFHDWAAYAQDQFKVSPKFTFDYGVRYEYFGVQHNNNPALDSNFVLGAGTSLPEQIRNGQMYTANTSPVGGLWHPQYGTVSPRIGFAYDLFGTGHSSIRGGYGISYERNFGNVTFNVIQNPPNYAVIVIQNAANNVVTNSNAGPLAGASGSVALPNTSGRWVDQNIRTAQTQFFSLSFDQQVGHNSVVSVSYNGARGIHLYDIKNYNGLGSGNSQLGDPVVDPVSGVANITRLNYQFSNLNQRGSEGDSYYHAVNVQFSTQDINHSGLSIVANYTVAHATDDLSTTFSEDASGNYSLGYTDPFNPSLDHGNSDFDIRQRFVVAPIYRTPSFFRQKGGALAQLLGGYEITGIYTARTGTPFTMYDSTYNFSGYNIPRYNPISQVTHTTFKKIPTGATNTGNNYQLTSGSGQTVGSALPVDNPFYNSLYAPYSEAAGAPGISDWGPYPTTMTARNLFRGPGAYNLNVSFSKIIPIHERLNLELRAEGYNVTNHHNLYIQESQDDAGIYNESAGANVAPQIFASKGGVTGGPNDERRFLQFAGKIHF